MVIDIGKIGVEYMEKPEGVISEFITYLASNANRIGRNCALNFYLQEEMEQMATDYIDLYPMQREQVDQLYGWVQALSWPKTGRLALIFDW